MQTGGRLENVEAACALVGASILCSLFVQHSFTQQSELSSEVICWTILPLLSNIKQWQNVGFRGIHSLEDTRPIPSQSLWLIAAGLTISSLYKAENGMIELSPLITPLLLITQRCLQPDAPGPRTSSPGILSPLIWGSVVCALITILPSSKWGFWGSMLSIFAVIPQVLAYQAWMPQNDRASQQLPPLSGEKQRVTANIRSKIVAMLIVVMGVQTIMFGFGETQIIRALLVGVAKALFWLFILQTRRYVSWCIVPAIQTFSTLAARDPSTNPSDTRAVFNVVASTLALAQIMQFLPKKAKARFGLWVFLLAFLAPYLSNVQAIRSSKSSTETSFSSSLEHPVEMLVNNAKVNFDNLVQHQSRNYNAAYDEYRRRYMMEPPNGFEDWFNFASAHQSPIIDDFDTIYKSVSPFWKLSGAEILHVMNYAQTTPEIELWSCSYSSSSTKTRCSHPRRRFDRHISSLFDRLTKKHSIKLPDIKFLVNHLDEPRVVIPPSSPKDRKDLQISPFILTDMSHQPVWNALTRACDTNPPVKPGKESFVLPFVREVSTAMDLCQHPEYQSLHGLLMNPTSFRLMEGLVPVLTTGTLSTMGDILYPSPAYLEDEFQYDEAGDVDWGKKTNNLYWAGSTTGAYASDGQWRNYHRQRFVSLTQNLERKRHVYLRESDGVVNRVASKFLNGRLFDVAFTKVFQCTMKYCRDQRAYLKLKPWADKYKAFRSRLAFDIDGNGISGRYYQLLASKSVPLKQTLIREWHDDRLVPWAHYVPVSQSLEELPELVSYLTTNEVGQRKAKEIADLGREWHSKAFREIDFSIYVYRLLLELARLQDPKRQGMGNVNA